MATRLRRRVRAETQPTTLRVRAMELVVKQMRGNLYPGEIEMFMLSHPMAEQMFKTVDASKGTWLQDSFGYDERV